jgi:Flp pilus assembly pilin Flp
LTAPEAKREFIAALISVVIIGAVTLVGTNLSSVFNSIATSLQAA